MKEMKNGCSFFSGVRSWEPPLCLHSGRISSSSGGAELCSCMADQSVTDASRGMIPECSDPSSSDCEVKSCADCRTTKTPLWRAGPTGPKSLCNACGIRYRKNVKDARLKVSQESRGISGAAASGTSAKKSELSLKLQKSRLGLQRQRSMMRKHRIKWRRTIIGEVEQAAVLLMTLSYGFPIGLQSF